MTTPQATPEEWQAIVNASDAFCKAWRHFAEDEMAEADRLRAENEELKGDAEQRRKAYVELREQTVDPVRAKLTKGVARLRAERDWAEKWRVHWRGETARLRVALREIEQATTAGHLFKVHELARAALDAQEQPGQFDAETQRQWDGAVEHKDESWDAQEPHEGVVTPEFPPKPMSQSLDAQEPDDLEGGGSEPLARFVHPEAKDGGIVFDPPFELQGGMRVSVESLGDGLVAVTIRPPASA